MINYLKSSISISSYDGCTIGCKYCILSVLGERECVKKISDEEKLVENLLKFKLYTKEIPISVNNQTDPFLNKEVFESTIKILKILEEKQMENPVLVITKGYVNDRQVQILSQINLKLIILYTFSGLSEKLENRSEKLQIQTMEKLSKLKNIILINYYRPVIEGLNTDEKTIAKVANIVLKYCGASIISGIRINSHLKKVLTELNIKIADKYDPDHKVLLPETYNKILNVFKSLDKNYPVFKKTSCGISYILKRPDYNGHSARIYYCKPTCVSYPICIGNSKIGFCSTECPNYNICKKESEKQITRHDFEEALAKIDKKDSNFQINEHFIKLEGTYWQEEVSFLRHLTKKNIKADKLLKREDEFLISQ